MPTHSPTRRRYDHRFRELVHSTGDLQLALDKRVPRSTATSWLRTPSSEVVTLDLVEMSEAELRRGVAALRRRNERLAAVLRLLIVMLKVAGVSLVRSRIVEGSNKDLLLRAVERSRRHLSLRAALPILRLSSSRYHAWRRDGTCGPVDVSSCPRTSPQQLTVEEGREVRTMATSEEYRHVPTGTLALLAQRLGRVFASPATWYRLVRRHRWRRPRRRVHPAKPKTGIRASKPNEFWHVDTTVIRLLDGTRNYVHAVIDNFSRKIVAWRVADRFDPSNTLAVLSEATQEVTGIDETPQILTDGGVENFNSRVDELIDSGMLRRLLAMTDVSFSNSMIESWWRTLKHQWLYLNSLDSVATLRRLVTFYVEEHNTRLPHSAFKGQTPDETYFGTGEETPDQLEASRREARRARMETNRRTTCPVCE